MDMFLMKSCQGEHVLTKRPVRDICHQRRTSMYGDVKRVKLRASRPECTTA